MVALVYCIACQHGQHNGCLVGQPAPPGVMGGWKCRCKGECCDFPDPTVEVCDELATALPDGWPP